MSKTVDYLCLELRLIEKHTLLSNVNVWYPQCHICWRYYGNSA